MRIAFDAKRAFHNTSGLGNYSRDLIRGLVEQYPENDYLLFNPKVSERLAELKGKPQVSEIRPTSALAKKFSSLWRRFSLVKEAEKQKVDIFHGLSNELPSGIQFAKFKKVVTIHDLIFMRYPQWYPFLDKMIYYSKFKMAAQYADKIIAISEQTKLDIVNFFGIPEEKIAVVYQSCHPAFKKTYSEAEKEGVKVKYNLPEKFVLQVGTIEERKNLLYTIEACKTLEEVQLVVIGRKTAYFKTVQNFLDTNNMTGRVHFPEVDSMEELAIIYQLAHVFCYPSVFEGFGIPIIEALYSNVPVITNEQGVFPEAAGPDSYFVNLAKPEEMTHHIQELFGNETERERGIDKSRTFVSKFDDATILKALYDVYTGL